MAGGSLGEGRFAVRCEPDGGQGGVLVLIERAWPQPSPAWLRDAAERIGRTLDLYQTAAEVVDVAVPGFADSAGLYVTDRLLVANEFVSAKPGTGVVVRRLAARLAGQSEEVANDRLPAGEVLYLAEGSRRLQAISTGQPVLFDRSDEMEPEQLARQSGVYLEQAAAGYTFLAVPLAARGAVVGCAVFGRSPGSPGFSPGEVTLALELASRAALALDNARLYDRERRTAQALQRGLMPGLPQIPPGLEVAQKFLPVGDSVVGRRLARHRSAARRAGRAHRRRRDGPRPRGGRGHGAAAHRRAHPGRPGAAARGDLAQPGLDRGPAARRAVVRHLHCHGHRPGQRVLPGRAGRPPAPGAGPPRRPDRVSTHPPAYRWASARTRSTHRGAVPARHTLALYTDGWWRTGPGRSAAWPRCATRSAPSCPSRAATWTRPAGGGPPAARGRRGRRHPRAARIRQPTKRGAGDSGSRRQPAEVNGILLADGGEQDRAMNIRRSRRPAAMTSPGSARASARCRPPSASRSARWSPGAWPATTRSSGCTRSGSGDWCVPGSGKRGRQPARRLVRDHASAPARRPLSGADRVRTTSRSRACR